MFNKKKKANINEEKETKNEKTLENLLAENKEKERKELEEWDCEESGHKYEIIKKILYVDDVRAEISVPTGEGQFFLECKKCKKRRIFSGNYNIFNHLWEHEKMTTELFDKLNKEVREFLSEKQKEYNLYLVPIETLNSSFQF